jgi:hypothetical protein
MQQLLNPGACSQMAVTSQRWNISGATRWPSPPLIYRRRRSLAPRDYLFRGAVSGLVFGASEVVHYFTVNGVAEFYLTIQSAIPPIEQLLARPADSPLACG